ncbi:zinc finger protein VAR3, chloroplastic [Malania oleifera]|uniref:zinc finger protein VAR3, chloroplastic n=1 Tax=Malania oleifera TaxID=397392 RepID=UPI0025AE533E|nr:zinc finger protein VAR3, chloroplastic [Malania oleifera]
MGGVARFFVLLITPYPLLRPRPSLIRFARHTKHPRSISSLPHHLTPPASPSHRLKFLIKASQHLHTQSAARDDHFADASPTQRASHPWPEWVSLVDSLASRGYFDRQRFSGAGACAIGGEDEFAAVEDLSEEFVRAAGSCLAFARDQPNLLGLLPRRDIEVVVENGTPFLFKNSVDSAWRMKSFLGIGKSIVMESNMAETVDLMRFLLSYASNPSASLEGNNLYASNLVKSSVRNLLSNLAQVIRGPLESDLSASAEKQFPYRYGQTSTLLRQNIEMKRGDWICPRCNFMNFARNVKCLECEEARPKRQLTGGEWECPQCDFFNYGRNTVCLRCDSKRPGEVSISATNTGAGLGHGNGSHVNKVDVENRLAANEEKAERWFKKVSQMDSSSDLNSAIVDEDFPEIMPLRKGVNRFVVSTRKTPSERRLANAQHQRNLGNDGTSESNVVQPVNRKLDTTISRRLDEILGRRSASLERDNKSISGMKNAGAESLQSAGQFPSQYGRPRVSNSNYVPFVPLPAHMFAKKSQDPNTQGNENVVSVNHESAVSEAVEQTGTILGSSNLGKSGDSLLPDALLNQTESKEKEKEQAEKSERWFKKVAELHDVTDHASAISDEDFSEIMPMRKGENRFVVSKKKDSSLISPVYKRQMAMEQASNTNFVPFVPFPHDYFAKKDKEPLDGADLSKKDTGEISSASVPCKLQEKLDSVKLEVPGRDHAQWREGREVSAGSWNLGASEKDLNERKAGVYGVSPHNENLAPINPHSNFKDTLSNGHSGKENIIETRNTTGSLSGSSKSENDNTRESWAGKSLEGSAVKEPDPLDMSEEAKAERWFRRVAQIKDISELSQIPDEDFPSIMPMRKGVNRFVVSKRKTPLERRLTSAQYRKNLPVVSSEQVNKGNDNS